MQCRRAGGGFSRGRERSAGVGIVHYCYATVLHMYLQEARKSGVILEWGRIMGILKDLKIVNLNYVVEACRGTLHNVGDIYPIFYIQFF